MIHGRIHGEIDHIDYLPATTAYDGHIEYWKCNECKRLYADQLLEHEITPDDTVIPQIVTYTVRFVLMGGELLQSGSYGYGEIPVYSGDDPEKAPDEQNTYSFAGWSPEITPVNGDATYTAVYSSTPRKYTITFVDCDGTVLLSGKFAYGTTPVYSGDDPEKVPDEQNTYSFAGWSPEITPVNGDATYTAVYGAETNVYDVSFIVNGVAGIVKTAYGDTVKVPSDPTVEGSDFTGWFTDEECSSPADLTRPVTGAVAFYAGFESIVYSSEDAGELVWNGNDARDITFTIHRCRRDDETLGLFRGLRFGGKEIDPSLFTAEVSPDLIASLSASSLGEFRTNLYAFE